MTALLFVLSAGYCGLLLFLRLGMNHLSGPGHPQRAFISVIVAARNEEDNLPGLLDCLSRLDYDHFEIIIADDRSTDATPEILQAACASNPRLKWLRVDAERPGLVGKKNALTHAIEASRGEILAFCDADSLPPPQWLGEIDAHMAGDTDFVSGCCPLVMGGHRTFATLKNLERASHHAFAAGALGWGWGVTCTASNMAYRRSLFDRVGGFSGIGHIRSGDDDLMLQKIAPFARKMSYMFRPPVPAREQSNPSERVDRETRRASKFLHYPLLIQLTAGGIFFYYATLCVAVVGIFTGLTHPGPVVMALLAKLLCEWMLVGAFLKRTRQTELGRVFLLAELLYMPYYLGFGVRGTLIRYRWK